MACGVCPPVAAGSESLIAQASHVAPATPALDPPPLPGPSTDPPPLPGPSADPEPLPGPATDPEPQPGPATDPEPQPGPSTDPEPQPGPATDPEPRPARPRTRSRSPARPRTRSHSPTRPPTRNRTPTRNQTPTRPPTTSRPRATPRVSGRAASTRARHGHPRPQRPARRPRGRKPRSTQRPPRISRRPRSRVLRWWRPPPIRPPGRPLGERPSWRAWCCGEAKPMALDPEPGQLVPDLLTALRAQTEQRESRARARASGASVRKPPAARRDSSPAPILPLGPCRDTVAGSAAGPGGIAPSPLGCVICTADAVRAAHELRRLRAPLLALDLPGLPSLRDRPG